MKKLTPQELTPGMVTLEPVRTPLGQILAPAGAELTRQLINKMKLYNIEYAVIDVEEDTSVAVVENTENASVVTPESTANTLAIGKTPAEAPVKKEPKTRVEEEKTHAQRIVASSEFQTFEIDYSHALSFLQEVFDGISRKAYTIEIDELIKSVEPLFISRNTITELFDMINQMHSLNDSVYAHCVNVALIARMMGRWLHLEQHDLDILTCCGLLHDIGKIKIPDAILNKPDKLTPEEYHIVQAHTKFGYNMLRTQNIDVRIKQAALMHHERFDGSGYPNHLTPEYLTDFPMIIAIADVYDAMTAARSYRSQLCPFEVIANFETEGYQKYHTKYLYIFLHRIASTYENNRVMLNDGRACKIVMINQNALSRPIVSFDGGECLDLSMQSDIRITRIL